MTVDKNIDFFVKCAASAIQNGTYKSFSEFYIKYQKRMALYGEVLFEIKTGEFVDRDSVIITRTVIK